jgi:small subunit ribosomal protein S6
MTSTAHTYDLVLLLDPQADDAVRAKIVADTRVAVEAQGELLRYDIWGERPLAYPLAKKTSAEYHLFQFHASTTELLDGLDRTLRITDGVLRFRLIKLKPGVPEAPDMRAGSARTAPERRPTGADDGERSTSDKPAESGGESSPAGELAAVAEPS